MESDDKSKPAEPDLDKPDYLLTETGERITSETGDPLLVSKPPEKGKEQ